MNDIHILDCTLRDGGYCNEWQFGYDNIKKITHGLQEADIDIIECGFITNKTVYNPNITKFNSVENISDVIPQNKEGKLFVAMINYGEYSIDDIPTCDGSSIDGIRVAFHKKNLSEAISFCEQIKRKGYLVFVQAMVSLSYTDEEFLSLIRCVNKFNPYAFYIVDSFGMMKSKDLIRLFYMVEHNLNEDIYIGFHSHNNMQLAYSNAQKLSNVQTNRNLIIDSSIYGMGRGAGNLNTELFLQYLNENAGKSYKLKPILILIDEILNDFYQQNNWGYSLPNYISASHNAHPNYASFLDDKKTLTIDSMNDIFDMMEEDKKVSYDKTYIEELYLKYMTNAQVQEKHRMDLYEQMHDREVLLVAPGKSSIEEGKSIVQLVKDKELMVISVNHVYPFIKPNYIFISNIRRFRELNAQFYKSCITTSNIDNSDVFCKVNYRELLSNQEMVRDNAGLMAIRYLMKQGVKKIYLAGYDGYSHDISQNYASSEMTIVQRNAVVDAVNDGMKKVLKLYSKEVDLEFVTKSRLIKDKKGGLL